jgi:hypothetical protein
VREQEFRDFEPILDASFRTQETDTKLDRDRQAESMRMPLSLARRADHAAILKQPLAWAADQAARL